jgi:4-aminobutyrate aminotransferase-like enzyme
MAHENAPNPNVDDRMSAPPWASKVPLQSATAPSIISESSASRPSFNSARSGMADDLCKNAREMGEYATQRLHEMMGHQRLIGNVRGPGLFVSLELVKDRETKEPAPEAAAEVYRLGVQKGVLFGENRYAGLGNLIKIKPPLDVTRAQMSHALEVLDEVLVTIEQTMR